MTTAGSIVQALDALRAHLLRTVLSALGIVVGIATVIATLAVGEGARRAALDEIGALGIDNVLVRATRQPALRVADGEAIARRLALDDVALVRTTRAELQGSRGGRAGLLAGVSRSWAGIHGVTVASGRWLSQDDVVSRRRVAIVGSSVARRLFAGDAVGEWLRAGRDWYHVVGILAPTGRGASPGAIQAIDVEEAVFVPVTAVDRRLVELDTPDAVEQIVIRARQGRQSAVAGVAARLLRDRQVDSSRFEVVIPRELLRARALTRRTFDWVLVGVAGLALLISGVGIMNIMLASVAERIGEVGVRRAVGARRADIVLQFTLEAALLCGLGGAVGVGAGVGLTWIIAAGAGWPVVISPTSVLVALALAGTVGLTFGLYPAWRAAAVNPVDALREI